MSNQLARNKALDEILGIEGAAEILEREGLEALNAKLRSVGVKNKEVDSEKAKEEEKPKEDRMGALLMKLVEGMGGMQSAIDEMKGAYDRKAAEAASKLEESEKQIKVLGEQFADVRKELNAKPRVASSDPDTALSDEAAKQARANIPGELDPFFLAEAEIKSKR